MIRVLNATEIAASRALIANHPERHLEYVLRRLPNFFEIIRALESDSQYMARQHVVVGAFSGSELIGTVAVAQSLPPQVADYSEDEEQQIRKRVTEHDLEVYGVLATELMSTFITAPTGDWEINSLAVSHGHRRKGIAGRMIRYAVDFMPADERKRLYIEFARIRYLEQLGKNAGFRTVRKSFSLSERCQYGCWGSILMRYDSDACEN